MKLIGKLTGVILSTFLIIPLTVSADYHAGGRTSPIFTAYYDGSVASYGYTAHLDTGRTAWYQVGKVNISKSSSNSSSYDEYYVGTNTDPTLLGAQTPYKNGTVPGTHVFAGWDGTWKYSVLSLYDNNMNNAGFSYNDKVGVAVHEVGHTLALKHTTAPNLSVMASGTWAGNPTYLPTTYDIGQLKAKWGITP